MPLSPPFVLVDRYEVTHEIGRGGYAVVYRAGSLVEHLIADLAPSAGELDTFVTADRLIRHHTKSAQRNFSSVQR